MRSSSSEKLCRLCVNISVSYTHLSNWSEKNYDGINFYDVFDRLLSMEEKTDEFKEGKTYEIPKESFETIFQKYFNTVSYTHLDVYKRQP